MSALHLLMTLWWRWRHAPPLCPWVVSLLVFPEVAGVRVSLRTQLALVRSLSCVDVPVDLQVPELAELLAADVAVERSLPRVSPQVRHQVSGGAETPTTEPADAQPPFGGFLLQLCSSVPPLSQTQTPDLLESQGGARLL